MKAKQLVAARRRIHKQEEVERLRLAIDMLERVKYPDEAVRRAIENLRRTLTEVDREDPAAQA